MPGNIFGGVDAEHDSAFRRPQVLTVAARLTEDRAARHGHGTITAVFRYFRDLGRRQQ